MDNEFTIDEQPVPFVPGQTILEAAKAAGVYIPHLCFQPDFKRHGGCKLCTVLVNGRTQTACTHKAAVGQEVDVNTPELDAMRRSLVQMLFIEGNHFCPACEKSGACQLQALGYEYEMMSPHFVELYPHREVDASHPDVLLDFNRCILCELCVRASRDVDHKEVFAVAGRGLDAKLIINSPTGKLGDSAFAVTDRAAHVCPVGAIIVKRVGFATAIGERPYDLAQISAEAESCELPEAAK
ncbi:2Fe-2S iron-sulfur cluster-binding protein [Roseiarcus sp.]|uniref:2Fe-2S iron-sulfur cluster-binding protein n=1 Tax=Roseiarcus sp. TaxID=1969460 RepID=UPI003F960DDD